MEGVLPCSFSVGVGKSEKWCAEPLSRFLVWEEVKLTVPGDCVSGFSRLRAAQVVRLLSALLQLRASSHSWSLQALLLEGRAWTKSQGSCFYGTPRQWSSRYYLISFLLEPTHWQQMSFSPHLVVAPLLILLFQKTRTCLMSHLGRGNFPMVLCQATSNTGHNILFLYL